MMNSKLKTQNSKLIVLVAVFVGLAALYSAIVPLGEGPDEPGHAAYVFFLARERRLPDQRANEVPGEGHQPPLAYALAAPLVAWLPADQRLLDQPGNPRFVWAGGNEPNAVAHGSREYWPWRGAVLAWHLARLVSVALGAATVVFTYLAARELDLRCTILDVRLGSFADTNRTSKIAHRTLLAAAIVVLNPQFLFIAGLVTNDALLTALSALLLWLAVRGPGGDEPRTENQEPGAKNSLSWPVWIGLVLGLALLTKQSALLLAPIALLAVVWPGGQRIRSLRRAAAAVGVLLLVTGLVAGWWYWRNWQLYGDPLGLAVFQAEFAGQPFEARSPAAWLGALIQLHGSFWARFGWMNVHPPGWVHWPFALLELLALVGCARWLLQGQETGRPGDRGTRRPGDKEAVSCLVSRVSCLVSRVSALSYLLAFPLLAAAWLLSFALAAGLVAWQGRLLFPALPAIAILLAMGIENVKWRMQNGAWLSYSQFFILHFTFFAALAAWLPFGVIGPAYPRHTLPEPVALAQLGTPVFGRLGLRGEPGAELRGWQLVAPLRAGAAADLQLTWHARGRQNRDWTVFIHLVDAQETIVAEANSQPRGGAFPLGQWVAGDWIADRHSLAISASVPPGSYELRVGLYDARTQRRTGVFSQRGRLIGDYLVLGQVQVAAH